MEIFQIGLLPFREQRENRKQPIEKKKNIRVEDGIPYYTRGHFKKSK
jgi:hypothetical protein